MSEKLQWAFFLFGTIAFSVLGVLFPNWFKELSRPRSHNEIKLLNECLARHQFGYFAYFFALAIGANLTGWLRNLNWSAIGLALGFYGYGLFSSARLETRIADLHLCPQGSTCPNPLDSKMRHQLSRLNIIFAVITLFLAVVITILLTPAPSLK